MEVRPETPAIVNSLRLSRRVWSSLEGSLLVGTDADADADAEAVFVSVLKDEAPLELLLFVPDEEGIEEDVKYVVVVLLVGAVVELLIRLVVGG